MNCLLDTHTFLWAAMDPVKLSRQARVTILDAANDIHVSIVTFWEVSRKYALGKIELQGITPEELPAAAHSAPSLLCCLDFFWTCPNGQGNLPPFLRRELLHQL